MRMAWVLAGNSKWQLSSRWKMSPQGAGLLPGQAVGHFGEVGRAVGQVGGVQGGHHAGAGQKVANGPGPLVLVDAGQPAEHPQDTAHVAHVAVRVPAAHVADADGPGEVPGPVEHREGHHRGVGDNVAAAAVFVVAVMLVDVLVTGPPVPGVLVVKVHHRPDDGGVGAVRRDVGESLFHNRADVRLHKGQADAAGHEHAAVHPVAPVGDAGRLLRQGARLGRVAGGHQPPGIDEDLPADLFGGGGTVLLHAAAAGGGDAAAQVQVGGVLGGDTVAAPPEEAVLVGGVVQQRLGHVLGGEILQVLAVLQRLDEEHGPVAVVIGGEILVLGRVVPQLAEHVLDALAGPPLDGRPQPDADDLAQPPGIHLFKIVFGDLHRDPSFLFLV